VAAVSSSAAVIVLMSSVSFGCEFTGGLQVPGHKKPRAVEARGGRSK
jgi:hypothetical protein